MNVKDYITGLKSGKTLLEAANVGTSEGARKGWEHRKGGQIDHGGKSGYYNVNIIHSDGRGSFSQIYEHKDGGPGRAAKFVLEQKERGEQGNEKFGDMPVAHAFIHHTGTKETHHYDMTDGDHVKDLLKMAYGGKSE